MTGTEIMRTETLSTNKLSFQFSYLSITYIDFDICLFAKNHRKFAHQTSFQSFTKSMRTGVDVWTNTMEFLVLPATSKFLHV